MVNTDIATILILFVLSIASLVSLIQDASIVRHRETTSAGGRLRSSARVRLPAPAVHTDRGDPLVPRAGAAAVLQGVLDAYRHVERRMHLRRVYHYEPAVPRKVRGGPAQ